MKRLSAARAIALLHRYDSEMSAKGFPAYRGGVRNCTNSMSLSRHQRDRRSHSRPQRDERVGGIAIELATSASGENGGVRVQLSSSSSDRGFHSAAHARATDDEVQHARALEHRDPRRNRNALDECAGDFGARAIAARVHDASARMRASRLTRSPPRGEVEASAGEL